MQKCNLLFFTLKTLKIKTIVNENDVGIQKGEDQLL